MTASERRALERHKQEKIQVLKELHVSLTKEERAKIFEAHSDIEVDRIGRRLILNSFEKLAF